MILTLQRDLSTPNETLGWLSCNGRKWPSIERAWVPTPDACCGVKGRSCVPAGLYKLNRHTTDAHPKVWALVSPELWVYHWPWEVPPPRQALARSVCLIHPANWASELRGCIAIGKQRVKEPNGFWKVTESRDAVNELRTLLGNSVDLTLNVLGIPGG